MLEKSKRKLSEEHKKRLLESRKGSKHSEETKKKISESRKGKGCGERNINYGKERSEEVKKKISDTKMGTKLSEETRNKMSELKQGEKNPNFGKHHSEEVKRKISEEKKGKYCGENSSNYGKKHSEETRNKISKIHKGKIISEETKKKISESLKLTAQKKRNEYFLNGGISKLGVQYNTYAHQLEIYEEIRCSKEGYLEVRCTYCGKWFMPKTDQIRARIKAINGLLQGESRLYCSQGCKKECPIYHKSAEQLMKEDAIRAGLVELDECGREVQPELRQLVFSRDNYECQICGSTNSLHCHHYEGIWQNKIESADVDSCVTLCRNCHIYKAHSQPGCTYYDMRKKICI